jgi:hypothetical protein
MMVSMQAPEKAVHNVLMGDPGYAFHRNKGTDNDHHVNYYAEHNLSNFYRRWQ